MNRVFLPFTIKSHARLVMRGNFLKCLSAAMIPALIVAGVFALLLVVPQVRDAMELVTAGIFRSEEAQSDFMMEVFTALIYGMNLITALFNFLIIGSCKVYLDVVRQKKARKRDIFAFYDKWYIALIMPLITVAVSFGADRLTELMYSSAMPGFLMELLLFLLQLLMIFINFKIAFVPHALADNGCTSFIKAFKASWQMTSLKAMVSLFLLYISFIGWFFLMPFTMGLLMIYVMPYLEVSVTSLYEAIRQTREAKITQ